MQGREWNSVTGKKVLRLQDTRYLYSIRHGFTQVMPIMIIGSIAILINSFPLPVYQEVMLQLWGEGWKDFGAMIYSGTFSIISLVVALAISSELAGWYRDNKNRDIQPLLAQIVSFCCVMVTINFVDGEFDLVFSAGVNGLFLTMIITVAATEIFLRFTQVYTKYSANIYASEASASVPAAMKAIWPAMITIMIFVIIRLAFGFCGVSNVNEGLNQLMQIPFQNSENTPLTALIFSFVSHFLWIFGIHGNNVLDSVAQNIYVPAVDANIAAVSAGLAPPHMYTKTFFDAFVYMGGSGTTLCLIIAILLFAKRSGVKRLAKISTPMSIFNINEPLMYGLPIVLNPVYIIPFLCTPLLLTVTTSLAMWAGLVPYTVASIDWTTPIFASGYAATGGALSGVILQAANLVAGVCIYIPFVRLADQLEQKRFKNAISVLSERADSARAESVKRLVSIGGNVGVAARQLSNDLCSLLRGNAPETELRLVYQPLIDTKEKRVFGYEALLRWEHPMHGNVPAPVIIALAEDASEMDALGRWILDAGLKQLAEYRQEGFTDLVHYTNVSVRQLVSPDFSNMVVELLKRHKIPPEALQLEMTESAILSFDTVVSENIEKLSELSVNIAIDDFGMGHSSLGYLEVFPTNTIKIEQSLTNNIEDESSAKLSMVRSIASLCGGLGIGLIAEHVETESQLALLAGAGCTKIQGYYFSKPLQKEELMEYVKGFKM